MKGTRSLDNDEIRGVSTCFTGTFATRNHGLFMLGVSTGGRISELLSLTYQNRAAVADLLYDKSIVKGEEVSRAVFINRNGRQAINDLIDIRKLLANFPHARDSLNPANPDSDNYQPLTASFFSLLNLFLIS